MVFERVISASCRLWMTAKSLVRDCVPRRAQDDLEPIISQEDREATVARLKSRLRLARLSGAVCGIEFCYAAETAFVSPVLLRIGIPHRFMTLIWCLSPLLGLFLMPLLGSASDRCKSSLGRRRPFIILLSIGVVIGLLLVPYGWSAGEVCDISAYRFVRHRNDIAPTTSDTRVTSGVLQENGLPLRDDLIQTLEELLALKSKQNNMSSFPLNGVTEAGLLSTEPSTTETTIPWSFVETVPAPVRACGMALTILGVMMLDFNCDAAQSPARAYLIDVTDSADHAKGLATFSFMAGLGGAIGYAIGGIPWNEVSHNDLDNFQVRVVFGIVLVIFVVAVVLTVTAEKEKALYELFPSEKRRQVLEKRARREDYKTMDDRKDLMKSVEKIEMGTMKQKIKGYGSNAPNPEIVTTLVAQDAGEEKTQHRDQIALNGSVQPGEYDIIKERDWSAIQRSEEDGTSSDEESDEETDLVEDSPPITMGTYLLSIVFMPWSMRILCLTHLLGWMSLLCYSLYFTDFVGQAVYGGDPTAPRGSLARKRYSDGVRMGSFAMAMYSITCSICSYNVDKLINKIGARPIYIANHLVYSISMVLLASVRTVWAAFLFSSCAGVQYSTLFTMPFLLVAHYHSSNTFDSHSGRCETGSPSGDTSKRLVRGLGTDIAVVQGMVFVAQLILSSCMGSIVQALDSTVVVVVSAAILSFLGAICASQVTYAGL